MMKFFLLFMAVLIVPIALSYGIDPAAVLPKFLNIEVEGTDQTQIFRALMCLYLGASMFWAIAAFKPEWRRVAVIWAVIFALSLAVGRVISIVVDGPPSRLLDLYLVVEVLAGFWGIALLIRESKQRP